MPLCPACNKQKPAFRNPRAGGETAMCEDCWAETEMDLGGGQEIIEIDHIARQVLTVIKQNPDLSMRQVIEWEQRLFEAPDDVDVRGMYNDWLEERGCWVRAKEVRGHACPGCAVRAGEIHRQYCPHAHEGMFSLAKSGVNGWQAWCKELRGTGLLVLRINHSPNYAPALQIVTQVEVQLLPKFDTQNFVEVLRRQPAPPIGFRRVAVTGTSGISASSSHVIEFVDEQMPAEEYAPRFGEHGTWGGSTR